MERFLTILFLITIAFSAKGQNDTIEIPIYHAQVLNVPGETLDLPMVNGEVQYSGKIDAVNLNNQTFKAAVQQWVAKNFKDAKITTDTLDQRKLSVKADFIVPYVTNSVKLAFGYKINLNIELALLNNQLHYNFTNFYLKLISYSPTCIPFQTQDINTFLKYQTIAEWPNGNAYEKQQWIDTKKRNTYMLVNMNAQVLNLITQLNNLPLARGQ